MCGICAESGHERGGGEIPMGGVRSFCAAETRGASWPCDTRYLLWTIAAVTGGWVLQ